jgi:hypothetical protein
MLGVRREGITQAAGRLQLAGFISNRRGHISVLERSGLESRACECYAVVKRELNRLLSDVQYRQDLPDLSAVSHDVSSHEGLPSVAGVSLLAN